MPRSARRKTDNVLTMPSVESPTVGAIGSAGVTENDIARRAFELYCEVARTATMLTTG
jgi:hypothetical protein